mmetsp:Transcript_33118/g.51820  ORF Transcript_33118/g.51820 Transcript_33118/m.51820 type:complete len:91 (+) Transcript_33118:166-438(+)
MEAVGVLSQSSFTEQPELMPEILGNERFFARSGGGAGEGGEGRDNQRKEKTNKDGDDTFDDYLHAALAVASLLLAAVVMVRLRSLPKRYF